MACPHKKVTRFVGRDGENEFVCEACGKQLSRRETIGRGLIEMDMRDYFAGQALQNIPLHGGARQMAHTAYAIADAMLIERQKDKPDAERP